MTLFYSKIFCSLTFTNGGKYWYFVMRLLPLLTGSSAFQQLVSFNKNKFSILSQASFSIFVSIFSFFLAFFWKHQIIRLSGARCFRNSVCQTVMSNYRWSILLQCFNLKALLICTFVQYKIAKTVRYININR